MTSMSSTKAQLLAIVDEQSRQITDLQRQLQQTKWALETEALRWSMVASESNAIYGALDEIFALKVYAASGEDRHSILEWVVEDKATGEVLVERCAPLAAAYYEAIKGRLEEKQ